MSSLLFDFTLDKSTKTALINRQFDADLSLVWDAFTKPEILDQWWAPKPWKARTKKMDFKEGGHWLYSMVGPEGEEHWSFTTYRKIEDQKSYSGLDGFSDADGNINTAMPQSNWEIYFKPVANGTEVNIKISYDDLAQLEATIQMGFKEGLTMAMEGLDELLAAQSI